MRFILTGIVVLALACRQSTAPPVALTVSLQASTALVPRGDTVTFHVNATGNNLFGVIIDYGDETTEQYATGGALNARLTFKHVYSVAAVDASRL